MKKLSTIPTNGILDKTLSKKLAIAIIFGIGIIERISVIITINAKMYRIIFFILYVFVLYIGLTIYIYIKKQENYTFEM